MSPSNTSATVGFSGGIARQESLCPQPSSAAPQARVFGLTRPGQKKPQQNIPTSTPPTPPAASASHPCPHCGK